MTVNWRPEVINVAFMAVGRSEQTDSRGVGKGNCRVMEDRGSCRARAGARAGAKNHPSRGAGQRI